MGNFYMEATQINYRRDETLKTVDQKLQELSETSAIDTDIAPVFKSTNTYHPGDMVYYRNKLYVFNVEHTGAWDAADVTATDVTTELSSLKSGLIDVNSNLSGVFTADLLYEGAPTTAETYEEMNLISGKSITDYLLILFICRQYNNTVAFAIEPRHVFTQQTSDGSRVIFKYGDGAVQTVMVYYVSPTKIAVNQKTVDGAVWKTALYGIIKQP